jgi:branched-chain amino acid transport system substrate-binding protein
MKRTMIVLSALAGLAMGTVPSLAAEYKLGLTATYSGDFAAFGLSLRKGAELAVKQKAPADVSISLDIVDDHGSAQDGVLIAQRLCSDSSVIGVLGYTFSSIALAAVPIYDECKLPVLASAVTSPDLSNSSPYFRRDVMTDATQGQRLGQYAAKNLGLKNIYILHQQDDYGIGVANAFNAAVTANGGTIAGTEAYHLGVTDFRTILAKAKTTAPDAIFIGGFYAEAAKIVEQAKQLGIRTQFLGTDGALNAQLLSLSKGTAEGMIVYGMFDPSIASGETAGFVTAYRAAYNEEPDVWAALGYDAAAVVVSSIAAGQKSGSVTRESLNTALASTSGYVGVTGPLSFTSSGDREGELFFLQVKDGKFVPLNNR